MTAAADHAQLARDLGEVGRALHDFPGLGRALTDPTVPRPKKERLIGAAFPSLGAAARQLVLDAAGRDWSSAKAMGRWLEATAVEQAFAWAAQEAVLERAIDEVFAFSQLVWHDHEVRRALTDRGGPLQRRRQLARTLLGPQMTAAAVEVATAALASHRGTIDDAVQDYLQIGAARAGGKLAVARVAKPLPAEQRARLVEALQERLGATIILQQVVDPQLLGGVRVECGSEVIDASLAARLEAVRRDFA
jgi:F-type H+-transporting ATPase subunit delta